MAYKLKVICAKLKSKKDSGTGLSLSSDSFYQSFLEHCVRYELCKFFLLQLQDECELPQMHMLSVAMEPVLHKSCPPNCQDMLAWLPNHVALHVLSFLDSGKIYNAYSHVPLYRQDTKLNYFGPLITLFLSVSLCHCSQVNQTWNNLANSPSLWQNLCG